MDKPKKEPIALHQGQDQKLCLNCGFPNRPSDNHCMYCKTSLTEEKSFASWFRHTYYVMRWRLQLRQRRENLENKPKKKIFRFFGYFLVGVMLSLIGGYFFYSSLADSSFSKGLIAALFLLYGVFTLKSIFSNR